MMFSLGLGLTNECDLACAHCYRSSQQIERLTYEDVVAVCDSLPIRSVNLGTGENGLHPDFRRILGFLLRRDYRVSITSNSYSVAVMTDEELRSLHDVELSLDFPTAAEQDAFRAPGNWARVVAALERCRALGVETTIIAVLMNVNYHQMGELGSLAAGFGANLRVNVYQPVQSDDFALSYDEFWEGFRRLFAEAEVVACSEPVVNASLGLANGQSGCGRTTVRVSPRGEVLPCVYWPFDRLHLAELGQLGEAVVNTEQFVALREVPAACADCEHVASCAGGCASRRALMGKMGEPDPYCPRRHPAKARLNARLGQTRDLPKVGSACTTIVRGG
ncbi:MAG: radical SAM protein [Chloroflexota bacterium]